MLNLHGMFGMGATPYDDAVVELNRAMARGDGAGIVKAQQKLADYGSGFVAAQEAAASAAKNVGPLGIPAKGWLAIGGGLLAYWLVRPRI